VRRWHLTRQTVGSGHLYQGTYKSFPIEDDDHLLTVLRYVERNPVRPILVARAEHWRWSSLWRWLHRDDNRDKPALGPWPIGWPADWRTRVNRALAKRELEAVRVSVARGRPFGDEDWQRQAAKRLGLESTFRPPAADPRRPTQEGGLRCAGRNLIIGLTPFSKINHWEIKHALA
jgi:putative transposase